MSLTGEDIALYGAAGAAIVWFLKLVRDLVLKLDRLDRLASKELEHNHGSSVKDDVHGIAVSVGLLQREFGRFRSDFDHLRGDFDQHINERKTP